MLQNEIDAEANRIVGAITRRYTEGRQTYEAILALVAAAVGHAGRGEPTDAAEEGAVRVVRLPEAIDFVASIDASIDATIDARIAIDAAHVALASTRDTYTSTRAAYASLIDAPQAVWLRAHGGTRATNPLDAARDDLNAARTNHDEALGAYATAISSLDAIDPDVFDAICTTLDAARNAFVEAIDAARDAAAGVNGTS